jgi:uncharacterized protein (DUF1778 family)
MPAAISDRIDVRINREQKELIKFASDLSGFKSLTEFVIFCVNKEANKIIIENNQVLKSIADKKIFLSAILNPPAPNARLKKAASSYQKFIKANATDHKRPGKKV